MSRGFYRLCLALLLCASLAHSQTLAHPGWRGNGIASEVWWKHATFVRFAPDTTFQQATAAMDAMSEAGADSLILPDLLPSGTAPGDGPAQPDAEGASRPFDAKFGTEDDLDALLREASARRMHVLLRADVLRLAGNPGELRFWMSRGIAGFDLGDITPAQMDTLRLLHAAMDRLPGRRILLAHVPDDGVVRAGRQDAVTLHLLHQPSSTPSGFAGSALEVHTAESLKALPPNATLVVDAQLLTSEEAREDLRRTLAARGARGKTYSARDSTARSPKHSRRRRSR